MLRLLTTDKGIRALKISGWVVLVASLLAQPLLGSKGYFSIDGWLGFGAWFGFGVCVLMVILANALGFLLKREQHYYDSTD